VLSGICIELWWSVHEGLILIPVIVVRADVVLQPHGDVYVCPEAISVFTCNVSGGILQWQVARVGTGAMTVNYATQSQLNSEETIFSGIVVILDHFSTSLLSSTLTVDAAALDTTEIRFPIEITCSSLLTQQQQQVSLMSAGIV
jgi:hypothetical protein